MEDPVAIEGLSAAVDFMLEDDSNFELNKLERELGPLLLRWFMGGAVTIDEFPAAIRDQPKLKQGLAIKPNVVYPSAV